MVLNEVEKQLAYEKLEGLLSDLIETTGHSELFGVDLRSSDDTVKERLLRKFLQANEYEITTATEQLKKTLEWRKEFKPLAAGFEETHESFYDEVGLLTKAGGVVVTWNLYGAVKDRAKVFGNLEAFLRWRVGLMERSIALCDFSEEETSYITQVHDYDDVSFLRLDSDTKAASKETINMFQSYYPELLERKFFVNVPRVMSWIFMLVKPWIAKETQKKFVVLSDAKGVAKELGDWVPRSYGGKAEDLASISEKDPTSKPAPETNDVAVEEVKTEEPKVEEPKVEEPKVEEPKVEEPKVEEPKVEDPKVEEPEVEEPKVEEPKVEEPKFEEPKVEEPKVEEPMVEEPKVEEPKVEEPKTKEINADTNGVVEEVKKEEVKA
ncbi:phosphatidylinositol transfer protein Sfh5p [Trichomonascus vanleenenianus]|uniref:Sfh5p n=1 Tax=Trichomonascus vanleenenianus TaxID=2268995 RepID=UPI003ECB0F72